MYFPTISTSLYVVLTAVCRPDSVRKYKIHLYRYLYVFPQQYYNYGDYCYTLKIIMQYNNVNSLTTKKNRTKKPTTLYLLHLGLIWGNTLMFQVTDCSQLLFTYSSFYTFLNLDITILTINNKKWVNSGTSAIHNWSRYDRCERMASKHKWLVA